MALRFSDSQTPSDSRVQTAESGEIYLCVSVCVCCVRSYEREGGLLEKRTKEGGGGV